MVTTPKLTHPQGKSQDSLPLSITVDVRPVVDGKIQANAFADVTIQLGSLGFIQVLGFSVFDSGSGCRVIPPARKGQRRYFDIVVLRGEIGRLVEAEILREYEARARER
jgi:hypothetical protein